MSDEQQAYTYPDAAQGNESYSKSSLQGGTETIKSIVTNRRVMTLIALALLCVFFMMRKNKRVQDQPKAPPVHKVAEPLSTPSLPVPPPVPPAPVMQVPPQPLQPPVVLPSTDPKVMEDLRRVEQGLSELGTEQKQIQEQQSAILDSLNQLKTGLELVHKQAKQTVPEVPEAAAPRCVLQAIIEGRAWLYDGQSLRTVVVGDNLPGYGYIVDIQSDAGYVETSSGKRITFNAR